MMPQFNSVKNLVLNYKNVTLGIFLFVIGLFKKVCLADVLSLSVLNGYTSDANITILEAWLIFFAYTFQIYFDFSGYTDMALGIAKVFNIELPLNFNSPLKAVSVSDFWRRWHMTLGRLLKDLVYIPLGGNRRGKLRVYFNLFFTFLLCGIWHGARWNYVIYGIIQGVGVCIDKFFSNFSFKLPVKIAIAITFLFACFSFVFFRAETFEQAQRIFTAMFNVNSFVLPSLHSADLIFDFQKSNIYPYITFMLSIILVFFSKNSIEIIDSLDIKNKKVALQYAFIFSVLFICSFIRILLVSYSEFIYFNF